VVAVVASSRALMNPDFIFFSFQNFEAISAMTESCS
jgi:hypothetical protein